MLADSTFFSNSFFLKFRHKIKICLSLRGKRLHLAQREECIKVLSNYLPPLDRYSVYPDVAKWRKQWNGYSMTLFLLAALSF